MEREGGSGEEEVWLAYVFLLDGALFAIVGIRDAGPAADGAAPLVGAVVTLVADADQRTRPHVRVAHHALAVALLTETTYGCRTQRKDTSVACVCVV